MSIKLLSSHLLVLVDVLWQYMGWSELCVLAHRMVLWAQQSASLIWERVLVCVWIIKLYNITKNSEDYYNILVEWTIGGGSFNYIYCMGYGPPSCLFG